MRLQTQIVSSAMAIASRSSCNCDKKENAAAVRFNWTPITRKTAWPTRRTGASATNARRVPDACTEAAIQARPWL